MPIQNRQKTFASQYLCVEINDADSLAILCRVRYARMHGHLESSRAERWSVARFYAGVPNVSPTRWPLAHSRIDIFLRGPRTFAFKMKGNEKFWKRTTAETWGQNWFRMYPRYYSSLENIGPVPRNRGKSRFQTVENWFLSGRTKQVEQKEKQSGGNKPPVHQSLWKW